LHPRRHLGVGGPREQPVALEGLQGHGEHSLRDSVHARLQVGVAQGLVPEGAYHQHTPLIAPTVADLTAEFTILRPLLTRTADLLRPGHGPPSASSDTCALQST